MLNATIITAWRADFAKLDHDFSDAASAAAPAPRVSSAWFGSMPSVHYVDNSWGGWGNRTVIHNYAPVAAPVSRDTQEEEKKKRTSEGVALVGAIATLIFSFFMAKAYSNYQTVCEVRKEFLKTKVTSCTQLQGEYIKTLNSLLEKIKSNRLWALGNRVALVAGPVLVVCSYLFAFSWVAGAGIAFVGLSSEAFRFGIHGCEGKHAKAIQDAFSELTNSLAQNSGGTTVGFRDVSALVQETIEKEKPTNSPAPAPSAPY